MFRNASDCLINVGAWEKQGMALHLSDLGGQSITSSAVGKFFITVIAGATEMGRNPVSERTSAVLQSKKARKLVFNHRPFGFDREGDKLVKSAQERALLQRIQFMKAC